MANVPTLPGSIQVSPLVGNEWVEVVSGAVSAKATSAQIAGLSGSGVTQDIVSTPITTVGNGVLTAAAIIGGLVTRTGPVAAYTDTTDTAANILAALPGFVSGATFFFIVKNATAFTQTINGGTGVTMPVTNLIGAFEEGEYYGTMGGTAASPTIIIAHILTTAISLSPGVVSPAAVTLSTVGAGTITAAAFTAGGTGRVGTQSGTAFTDTTDTAANIIAASPGLIGKIGSSSRYEYANLTNAPATVTGGTGVTVSQPGGSLTTTAIIPANMTGAFNLTYTAAATITLVCLGLTNNNASTVTLAGTTSGQTTVTAGATPSQTTLTLPPVTGTVASTTGSDLYVTDVYRCTSAQTANTNTTPAAITGLSGAIAIGTYRFRAAIYCTIASGTGGVAISYVLTTAVLGACNFAAVAAKAATIATQATTTTTSATNLYTEAAQPILVTVEGTFTCTTAGTLALFMCQNTSNGSNSVVNVGSYMEVTRIA